MNNFLRLFRPSCFLLVIFPFLPAGGTRLSAETLYWDANGATAGSGNKAGDWDKAGSVNWTSDSTGVSATTGWIDGSAVVFSAGVDGTGAWTVKIEGTIRTPSIEFQEGAVTVISGGSIDVTGGLSITNIDGNLGGKDDIQSVLSGTGNLTLNLNGTAGSGNTWTRFSGINTFTGSITVNRGVLQIFNTNAADAQKALGNANNTVILDGGTLMNDNQSFSIDASHAIQLGSKHGTLRVYGGTTMTVNGVISGVGNLSKTDGGTLVLTANNTYGGTTTVAGGILSIGNGGTTGTLGMGNVDISSSTAVLSLNRSDSYTVSTIITGVGTLSKEGAGTVILTGDNSYAKTTVAGGVLQIGNGGAAGKLGTGAVNISNAGATLAVNLNYDYTIAGLISGAGSFNKDGTNTVILTAENTYGKTTVAGGTLQLGSGGTTGKLGNGDVSLAAGSILLFNRSNFYNVANVISGDGALVVSMQGGGTIALVGANTYKGGTTVNIGFARATADSGFGDITGGIFLNGGTLMNNDSFLVLNAARTITLGSGGGDFRVGWAKSITINGRITGTGELRLNNDSGVLILAGTGSDYTGDTTIGVGAGNNITLLRLGASGVLPDGTRVRFNGGVGKTAVLDLNGNTETVGSLVTVSGSGTVTNSAAATTATLTVAPASGSATYAGLIENGAGVVAVGKTGAGTQEFTGDNTYTGGTTISQGTLLANNFPGSGSALGTGSVLVTSGGRLGGTGSVIPGNGASITVTAGKLMVGNTHGVSRANGGFGAEKLILGGADLNVSISLNGTLQFDIVDVGSMLDVGNADYNYLEGANDTLKISTNGTLNLDNAIIELAVEDTSSWDEGQTWKLIDWSGSMPSSFSAQNLQLLTNNIAGFNIIQHIVESGEGAGYYITLAAVPEPSRALLVLLGTAFCALRRRRPLQ